MWLQLGTQFYESVSNFTQFGMSSRVCLNNLVDQLREQGELLTQENVMRLLDVIAQLGQQCIMPLVTNFIPCRLGVFDLV